MEQDNKLYWVYGNTQPLLIPLEMEVMTEQEEIVAEPYYPDADAVVTVNLTSHFKKYSYTPVVNGNLLTITDDGTLPKGCYGVEILVVNPDGSNLRSKWENQIVVTDDNVRTLQEWDEFKEQDIKARAALFFFAKGDPFTYEDFTPEEIEELQKPARDAAAEIREDYALVKQDAQQATSDANDAAQNANDKAGVANDAATNANDKGTYAKEQGDYAKEKADEIEDASGSYANLDARLDAMEVDTNDRFERITQAQFNEIFT